MCVAYPGRVLSFPDEKTVEVDFDGNKVRARTGLVSVQEGDLVLVHCGCVLQKVSEADAAAMKENLL